jgi:hypothetical protein
MACPSIRTCMTVLHIAQHAVARAFCMLPHAPPR